MRPQTAVTTAPKTFIRRGAKPFGPMILSFLLASLPWAVCGLIYSFVTGDVGTQLAAIVMWGVIAIAAGAATATAPDERFNRPATRTGLAIGMLFSLGWMLVFYLQAPTLVRSGLAEGGGWFEGSFSNALISKAGNLAIPVSGIFGLIKGAIVGSTAATIFHSRFEKKEPEPEGPPTQQPQQPTPGQPWQQQ